jgi:hypothetical protein
MKLKLLGFFLLTMTMGAMWVAPAFAQSPHAEEELRRWMARDPRLEADPGLMENPIYLHNHPEFAVWLQNHQGIRRQIAWMGAYDEGHRWHDIEWWRANNPNWIYANHPEWIQAPPEWRQYGDWGDDHVWHDRGWWAANHPEWVNAHHPDWAAIHHEEAVEHHEAVQEHREAVVEHREDVLQNREQHLENREAHIQHQEQHLQQQQNYLEHH